MAAQSPFVSSSTSSSSPSPSSGPTPAQLGGCGGVASASCVDPPSSSQPVSLSPASPAGVRGRGGAFLPPPHPSSSPPSSSSSSSAAAPPPKKDPDSPDSPFEVVPDGAAFDREYGGALLGAAITNSAAILGERGVLSQIPEDRVCDFRAGSGAAATGSGGVRSGAGSGGTRSGARSGAGSSAGSGGGGIAVTSCRGTAAALEEVSKCVREMHTFTNELLTWDWVERNDVASDLAASASDGVAAPYDVTSDVTGSRSADLAVEESPVLTPHPLAAPQIPPRAAACAPRAWGGEGETLRELGGAPQLGGPPPDTPTPPTNPPQLLPCSAAHELLLWRDPRKTGLLFLSSLLLLLSLALLSAVSVLAHLGLTLLSITISLRLYRGLVQALQKTEGGHPFQSYLDLDLTLTPETFQTHVTTAAHHLNRALRFLLRLFLVEDLVDSLKLAAVMWLLTYVGAVFNGITLLILAELLAFTLPPLYEKYKVQIDHYVELAQRQGKELVAKIQSKVPGLAKKKPE